MAATTPAVEPSGFGATLRRDAWWLQPLAVGVGLGIFLVYSTWAAWQGNNYEWGPYLSPFYSPLIVVDWWNWSPAFLILWMPAGFRLTCYYYRKAYYRAYFLDPPACAVGEFGEHRYCGENKFPFIFQNTHRYFFYLAVVVLAILWKDAYEGFFFEEGFGIGIGSLVLLANSTLLSFYTFGCHSLRHLIGGKLDSFHGGSCAVRHSCWKGVTRLNEHHMLWAWISLFWVGFTDFYVRMVASGMITDVRLF
ncbi:MAG: succinate dehydrogenase [Acidobacteria bacterium]|nr:succinate dehydrogenase [Acidobacteriota bacterium]